jgi:predicted transposase YbfD/YdcC
VFASPSLRTSGCLDQLKSVMAEFSGSGGGSLPARRVEAVAGLRERLSELPDPRARRGLRHSLVSILLITICALAADKNGYTHIEAWARDAPTAVLEAMDVRFDAFTGARVPPDESTIRDVLSRLDAAALARATAAYLAERPAGHEQPVVDEREARRARAAGTAIGDTAAPAGLAADGKRLAGARRPDDTRVNLLSLVDHATGTTRAQHEIAAKTNEIPELATLLAGLDLTGVVISVDALHTQRDTATMIAGHGAYYFMTVKGNQPTLQAAIAARLGQANSHYQAEGRYHCAENRGHGRVEQRQIRTADATGIDFPHAAQIMHIVRRSKNTSTPEGWNHKEHVYAITNLPEHLAGPADLARYARGHWAVENSSHYVRDVTFGEDASQTRTANAPANLATCRNLVIGAFRQTGHTNIAHARTLHANRYERALTTFDL